MPNTTLPENVSPGNTGHIGQTNIVHSEVNRMSRDTGYRDLRDALVNGWTVDEDGFFLVRRVDDTTTIYFEGLRGAAASNAILLTAGSGNLSSGFFPDFTGMSLVSPLFLNTANRDDPFYLQLRTDGSFRLEAFPVSGSAGFRDVALGGRAGQWSWKTQRAWPQGMPPEVSGP